MKGGLTKGRDDPAWLWGYYFGTSKKAWMIESGTKAKLSTNINVKNKNGRAAAPSREDSCPKARKAKPGKCATRSPKTQEALVGLLGFSVER